LCVHFQIKKHAFDAVLVGTCAILQSVVITLDARGYYSEQWESCVHFLMAFRLLTLPAIKTWLYSLYQLNKMLLNTYWAIIFNLILLITLISYSFASIGNLAFCGKLDGDPGYIDSEATFDTLTRSMVSMFQIFSTNNWNDVMFGVANKTNLWSTVFFITYFIAINIVVVNLFVALICDMISAHWRRGNEGEESRQDLMEKLRQTQRGQGFFGGFAQVAKVLMAENEEKQPSGLTSAAPPPLSAMKRRSLVNLFDNQNEANLSTRIST